MRSATLSISRSSTSDSILMSLGGGRFQIKKQDGFMWIESTLIYKVQKSRVKEGSKEIRGNFATHSNLSYKTQFS